MAKPFARYAMSLSQAALKIELVNALHDAVILHCDFLSYLLLASAYVGCIVPVVHAVTSPI